MALLEAPSDGMARARLYAGLLRRNRIVGVLRYLVPVAGIVALVAVGAGLVLDSLADQFGLANIHIDRNNLVVDTPQLSSTLADGTTVSLHAGAARLAVGNNDEVELENVAFAAARPDGTSFAAEAGAAHLVISAQTLTVAGQTTLSSSRGFSGTAQGLTADVLGLRVSTKGAVDLRFGEGNTLVASDMTYEHQTGTFVFHNVHVRLTRTPGAAP